MKRLIGILLALVLACGLTAAAEELVDAYCAEQDFSTRAPKAAEVEFREGSGLYIWLDGPGYVPNVLIWRRTLEQKFSNPVNYLDNVYRKYMEERYGGNVTAEACRKAEMGGRTVYLARYHYQANGNRLCMTRVVETRPAGDVEYAAKYPEDDPDACLAALMAAVSHYSEGRPGQADAKPKTLKTSAVRDSRFHMDLPAGWQIMTQGEYTSFCFRAWDPAHPDRAFFLFMKLEPFLKSAAAQAQYRRVSDSLGPGNLYEPFAYAPYLRDFSLKAFLDTLPDCVAFCQRYYPVGLAYNPDVLPQMRRVKIVGSRPSTLPAPAGCQQNIIATVTFQDDRGRACEGVVTAQPVNFGGYDFYGVDGAPCSVYLFTGMTAPQGEMTDLLPTLSACLNSFGFEESYVRKAVGLSNDETQALLAVGREMAALHTAMVEAWLAQ